MCPRNEFFYCKLFNEISTFDFFLVCLLTNSFSNSKLTSSCFTTSELLGDFYKMVLLSLNLLYFVYLYILFVPTLNVSIFYKFFFILLIYFWFLIYSLYYWLKVMRYDLIFSLAMIPRNHACILIIVFSFLLKCLYLTSTLNCWCKTTFFFVYLNKSFMFCPLCSRSTVVHSLQLMVCRPIFLIVINIYF